MAENNKVALGIRSRVRIPSLAPSFHRRPLYDDCMTNSASAVEKFSSGKHYETLYLPGNGRTQIVHGHYLSPTTPRGGTFRGALLRRRRLAFPTYSSAKKFAETAVKEIAANREHFVTLR